MDRTHLSAVLQAYLTSFARRCSAYLPPNKVEMISRKCKTERITRNGFGFEVSRACIEWVDERTGLLADPALYAAKIKLDDSVAADIIGMAFSSNAVSRAMETMAKVRGARTDMVRLVGMNACEGPGLKRFGENLRRFALNLTPLKLDGDHVFYLEDLEHSRDPERFAHFLLWNMTPYGQNVRDRPERSKSFEVDYAATRETFNALAKLHGRDKLIAAAQRILRAPKVRHPAGFEVLADPHAIECVQIRPELCYRELVPFAERPGAPPPQPRASFADRQSLVAACESV